MTFRFCLTQIKNDSVNFTQLSRKRCHVTVFRHSAPEYRASPAPVSTLTPDKLFSRSLGYSRTHRLSTRRGRRRWPDGCQCVMPYKRYNARYKAIPFVVSVRPFVRSHTLRSNAIYSHTSKLYRFVDVFFHNIIKIFSKYNIKDFPISCIYIFIKNRK